MEDKATANTLEGGAIAIVHDVADPMSKKDSAINLIFDEANVSRGNTESERNGFSYNPHGSNEVATTPLTNGSTSEELKEKRENYHKSSIASSGFGSFHEGKNQDESSEDEENFTTTVFSADGQEERADHNFTTHPQNGHEQPFKHDDTNSEYHAVTDGQLDEPDCGSMPRNNMLEFGIAKKSLGDHTAESLVFKYDNGPGQSGILGLQVNSDGRGLSLAVVTRIEQWTTDPNRQFFITPDGHPGLKVIVRISSRSKKHIVAELTDQSDPSKGARLSVTDKISNDPNHLYDIFVNADSSSELRAFYFKFKFKSTCFFIDTYLPPNGTMYSLQLKTISTDEYIDQLQAVYSRYRIWGKLPGQ